MTARYDERVREARRRRDDAALELTLAPPERRLPVWLRKASYDRLLTAQLSGEHRPWRTDRSEVVCTCGLITSDDGTDADQAPGHRDPRAWQP